MSKLKTLRLSTNWSNSKPLKSICCHYNTVNISREYSFIYCYCIILLTELIQKYYTYSIT